MPGFLEKAQTEVGTVQHVVNHPNPPTAVMLIHSPSGIASDFYVLFLNACGQMRR